VKKFIYINQLNEERNKLLNRKKELECIIVNDWNELKKSISPKNLKEQFLFKIFSEKRNQPGFGLSILSDLKITLLNIFKNKIKNVNMVIQKWIHRKFFYQKK
jgi:hypothetical protein